MKKSKGEYGYIEYNKKQSMKKACIGIVGFSIIYSLGIIIFGSNANHLTLIAVLSTLPTALYISKFIVYVKYKPLAKNYFNELNNISNEIIYDMIIVIGRKTIFSMAGIINNNDIYLLTRELNNQNNKDLVEKMMLGKGIESKVTILNNEMDLLEKVRLLDIKRNEETINKFMENVM